MHGIKDPDLKEMTEATNEEETEIKEDAKVRRCTCSLYGEIASTCFLHSFFSFKVFYGYTILKIQAMREGIR